jgi:tetratricopeptide (TPR) repeat protein
VAPEPEAQPKKAEVPPNFQIPVEAEQSFLKTLEDLDHGLRSQGFIPLEPNSLSTLAQSQEANRSLPTAKPTQQEVVQEQKEEREEPTLSSALAQLGNLTSSPAPAVPASSTPSQPVSEPETAGPSAEPLWVAALSNVSIPSPRQDGSPIPPAQPPVPIAKSDTLAGPVQSPAPIPPTPVVQQPFTTPTAPAQEPSMTPPLRVDTLPDLALQPKPEPTRAVPPAEPAKVPVARRDVLLDDELEMTMKRPAIHLSSAQARSTAAKQEASVPLKGYTSERTAASKTAAVGPNYKERLLKGYQYQLVGDYDEAMQEYRIIIRNAPELLDDVVSNVRALLKLAPKYSQGYRVLGDAYMRQGEYLQAMEAYNKALTMAKRANV